MPWILDKPYDFAFFRFLPWSHLPFCFQNYILTLRFFFFFLAEAAVDLNSLLKL